MSSERTQPPSIAPKKAPAPRGDHPASPSSDAAAGAGLSRGSNGLSGARPSPSSSAGSGSGFSLGERIRRSAESLRGLRAPDGERTSLPPRTGSSPTVQRTSATSAGTRAGATAATAASARPAPAGGARKVRLAIARIDPWSVMKLSFLLSVAIGIMIVVAAAVVWQTLDNMAVFTSVNETIATIADDPEFFNLLEYAAFSRVLSLATMIAVVDVVLLTALSTIGAFLYNIVAALVGGVTITLTDD